MRDVVYKNVADDEGRKKGERLGVGQGESLILAECQWVLGWDGEVANATWAYGRKGAKAQTEFKRWNSVLDSILSPRLCALRTSSNSSSRIRPVLLVSWTTMA